MRGVVCLVDEEHLREVSTAIGALPFGHAWIIATMRISFHRLNDAEHELEVGDERVRCETRSLLVHDLVHFAVEAAAGLSTGFWGSLASGTTLATMNDREAYGGPDLWWIEKLVGMVQGATKASDDPKTIVDALARGAAASDESLPTWISVEVVADVLERMRRLHGHWKATPFGDTMTLEWPASDAPDVDRYLARIGYDGPREPTAEVLRRLQVAHMKAVPFENLDIALGRPISLATSALVDKILTRGRGGFCYELNALFAWLLRRLGFDVTLMQSQVFDGEKFGPPFDHLTLHVVADQVVWLADVGFGASFREPLAMTTGLEQDGFRIVDDVVEQDGVDGWAPMYRFDPTPRVLSEFEEMCRWQQTADESNFTGRRTISIATDTGRITLRDDRLIVTTDGTKTETPVSDFDTALAEHFGIRL